jgi:hypothetical protein
MDSLYLLRRAVGFHLAAWVETELICVQQKVERTPIRAKKSEQLEIGIYRFREKVLSVIVSFS